MRAALKRDAARAALGHVEDGMKLGIGTGSTAEEFVRLLAERVSAGLSIIGVPTSERTAALCAELGVPLSTLDETPELDLTIDGADELDSGAQPGQGRRRGAAARKDRRAPRRA
jgi:ribose 5-phosphate isomerase A